MVGGVSWDGYGKRMYGGKDVGGVGGIGGG